jgi:RNA polymerase sigma factor (sigma-70 family)
VIWGRRAQSQFDEEFEDLFAAAFESARRILRDVTDAEDAAAETMARAYLAWPKISKHAFREAWIRRVAINVAVDTTRRRRNAPVPPDQLTDTTEEQGRWPADFIRLLDPLPKRQRQVLALRFLGDLTDSEIADSLGISIGSVKQHVSRGLERLRQRSDVKEMRLAIDI